MTLSEKSIKELSGVNGSLVSVVLLAAEITKQPFIVHDGIRTLDEQKEFLRKGTTKTLESKHLVGLAVDLVPVNRGRPIWDVPLCSIVAMAMKEAAKQKNVEIRWGAVWDRKMSELTSDLEKEIVDYICRRKQKNKKHFIDAPHFELA